jgi:nucleotide-binding universal stress UspA family protein
MNTDVTNRPNLFERILVPTDMSDFGELALRFALVFSERLGSEITLLNAEEISWFATEHSLGYYFENAPEAKVALTNRLNAYAAARLPATVKSSALFADDLPERAIVKTAHDLDASLIIMGTHGRHGFRRALLGSVTERVLRETDIPVITVRPPLFPADSQATLRTVLCPVNFTDIARTALEQACAIAESFQAQLVVMHVADEIEPRLFGGVQEEFRHWVDPLVRTNALYKEIVVQGDAAEQVLDVADRIDADLLVIGAQHRLFHDATIIGTTTERITRFAKRAVMTVIRPAAVSKARAVA